MEWTYNRVDGVIYSGDFKHDAMLRLTGDFANDDQRTAYAEKICTLLNHSTPSEKRAGPFVADLGDVDLSKLDLRPGPIVMVNDKDAEDAARYRFLRDYPYTDGWDGVPRYEVSVCIKGMGTVLRGAKLDEQVDMELKANRQEAHGK